MTRIYDYYKYFGHQTQVMGASFRTIDEIRALAGCDLLTISPNLLEELAQSHEPLTRRLSVEQAKSQPCQRMVLDEKTFRWHLNADPMATEKLAEGIRAFAADTEKLSELIERQLL